MNLPLRAIASALACAPLLGAGFQGDEMLVRRVVFANTDPRQPVAGAKVLKTYWHTSAGLGHPTRGCSRAWLAETDADGGFRSPTEPEDAEVFTHIYKRGYRKPKYGESIFGNRGTSFLVPIGASETDGDRIRELNGYHVGILECRGARDKPALDAFREALLPELLELEGKARQSARIDDADAALYLIEFITLGRDMADSNAVARAAASGKLLGQSAPRSTIDARKVPVTP